MSEILTRADAENVLRELLPAQNESYLLGLALGLPIHRMDVVETIETTNLSPKQCLREVIIWFLVTAPKSRRNWRVIADALSDINHQVLAESIKAAHFPNSTPIDPTERDLATLHSDDALSDITGMLESCMHSKHCYKLYYGMGHI